MAIIVQGMFLLITGHVIDIVILTPHIATPPVLPCSATPPTTNISFTTIATQVDSSAVSYYVATDNSWTLRVSVLVALVMLCTLYFC